MSDTASDTAAARRRNAFTRLGLEPTSRRCNPTSPQYDDAVHRGANSPAGWVMTRVLTAPAREQYHSQAAARTIPSAPADAARVLRFTGEEPRGSDHQTAPRRWSGRARPS